MQDEKIIDKIKKLLELAASPNEHEASLAFEMARKLMAKYSVDNSSFASESTTPPEIIKQPYFPPRSSTSLLDNLGWITQAVGKPFGVWTLINTRSRNVTLVGFKRNLEVVSYAIDCVLNQAWVDFRLGYRLNRTIAYSDNFWKSFKETIEARFSPQEEDSVSLVVYDPIQAYINGLKSVAINSRSESSGQAGAADGAASAQSVQIRLGIGQSSSSMKGYLNG